MLAEIVHNAGVITNEEFAIFQNAGDMESTELIANVFRISHTEEKIRKDNVQLPEQATSVHYNVGRKVRNVIEKLAEQCQWIYLHWKRAYNKLKRNRWNSLKVR